MSETDDDADRMAVAAAADEHGWMDWRTGRWHPPTKGMRIGIASLDDESLAGYMKTLRRSIEDGRQVEMNTRLLRKARGQMLVRFALRMRYGAVDNHVGTDSYDRWHRLNEPPTYRFAASMDRWRAEHGQRHILDWSAVQ